MITHDDGRLTSFVIVNEHCRMTIKTADTANFSCAITDVEVDVKLMAALNFATDAIDLRVSVVAPLRRMRSWTITARVDEPVDAPLVKRNAIAPEAWQVVTSHLTTNVRADVRRVMLTKIGL